MSNVIPQNVTELLSWSSDHFKNYGIKELRLEAKIILSHVLGVETVGLYFDRDYILSESELHLYMELMGRKARREPVSYITGYKEFWSLEFEVNRSVLIPRPETECLVESVVPFLKKCVYGAPLKVLEIGTGSGAVIIALASEVPIHNFYASDISYDAVCVAKKNAIKNNVEENISFFLSNWFDTLTLGPEYFDLIISNPPYIKTNELSGLQPEIIKYEPIIALDGGLDGLNCIQKIIEDSLNHLCEGGLLAIEIGWDQVEKIKQIASSYNRYSKIEIIKDYSGLDRIIHMTKT